MADSPQLDAADAVAAFLNGRTVNGVVLAASAADQLPGYDVEDLVALKVDCVAATPFAFKAAEPLNRSTIEEECPVTVAIQQVVEEGDQTTYRTLKTLLRDVARLLAFNEIGEFGRPREDMTVAEFPDLVERNARFLGRVDVVYRVYTEAPA